VSNDNTRSLGRWLRERREELGIGLQQAQTETRIRAFYIEALEADNYAALPDPVVGRGFVRNYAAYLGLDVAEAMRLYSARVAPAQPVPVLADQANPFAGDRFEPVALHEMPGRRRRWLWLLPVLVLLVAALAALAWWQYPRIAPYVTRLTAPRRPATATAPIESVAETLPTVTKTVVAAAAQPSRTPIPTTPPSTATKVPTRTPSATPTSIIYTGIFLELNLTDKSWLQIAVDGIRQFQGELEAGTYRSWFGEQIIELRVGNAGAVSATLNGQKLGPLGAPKEVVDLVFEKAGDTVISSTPTPIPTATRKPRATASPTPKPSATRATSTPSPTP
jgi:cytoskeletal protein RodZ